MHRWQSRQLHRFDILVDNFEDCASEGKAELAHRRCSSLAPAGSRVAHPDQNSCLWGKVNHGVPSSWHTANLHFPLFHSPSYP